MHSASDVALTKELAAGEQLDVELFDHLIIGQGRWLSLRRAQPDIFPPVLARVVDALAAS